MRGKRARTRSFQYSATDLAQVGLVLNGIEIVNTVLGGPAFTSMMLGPGDVLIAIDGKITSEHTVENMLIGCNIAGSLVTLTVAKGGSEVNSLLLCTVKISFYVLWRILFLVNHI